MTQIADRPARPDETLAVAVSDITQSLTMVQAINRALYDA
ncbi:alpha-ketoacid dehydrogenase subunit beta, partial [Mycobacterium tuberculosis]